MSSPIVDVSSKTVFVNTSIPAADLFTAFDSSDAITTYFVQDFGLSQSSGYFELNGIVVPHGEFFRVEAADLFNLKYVAGNQIGRERFRIMARDEAGNFSAASAIETLYSVVSNTRAPYSKAITFTILANEAIPASDIVWGYDPDGYPIETFHIRDRSVDFGFFEYDGAAKPQGTFFTVAAEDLDRLTYVSTGPNASELFDVIAFDGEQNSPQSVGFANTAINANRPVGQYSTASIGGLDDLPLRPVTDVRDADNSTIKKMRYYNTSPHLNNGQLVFKGAVQPPLTWIEVDQADFDQILYRPVNKDFNQQIRFLAYDGKHWSAPQTLAITTVEVIPPVKPTYDPVDVHVIEEQLINSPMSEMFLKTDSGSPYTTYEVYDQDTDPARAYISLDGIPIAGGNVRQLTADEYENRTGFYTGAFFRRSLDTIYMRANNGDLWGDWKKIDVRTEPEIDDVLVSGADWLSLLPRNVDGELVISFSFMQQFPTYGTGEAVDDDAPENFAIFNEEQRANTRIAMRHLETFANVQMLEVQDTTTNSLGQMGGIMRLGNYGLIDSEARAFAFLPNPGPEGGDMWFNRIFFAPGADANFAVGGSGYTTLLHELGHAMGLKHPHQGTPRLPPDTDFDDFTVMSYNGSPSGSPSTYQLYDIKTLQSIYGANVDHNSGDTVYSLANTWGNDPFIFETIWDGGGMDTLSGVGSGSGTVIDLRSGQKSTIGSNSNNINIALDSIIENGTGSDFNDDIIGNAVDNFLEGLAGDDYIYGNAGNDFLVGGAGDDRYEFGIADGVDIIDERQGGGADTLVMTRFEGFDSLADDFEFRMSGNDLVVDLTLNGGDSQGMVRVRNQQLTGYQIETLELNGVQIDLENLTSQITPNNNKFTVVTDSSVNGFFVAPV
jgi:hypothetical protein